jgi:hypothetical protein
MDYYRSIIEKYISNNIPDVSKSSSKSSSKTSIRAVKFENTYFSSKAQIDSLLSNLQFLEIANALTIVSPSNQSYSQIYSIMNDFLSNVDPKMTIDIISSTGIFVYSNKLSLEEVLEQPNQNTCPEVMASINFVFGNPAINKTAFPIRPVYPDSVAPMISAGYGLADRLTANSETSNNQYVAKTWDGINQSDNPLNNKGPLWAGIMTLRVSQNNFLL